MRRKQLYAIILAGALAASSAPAAVFAAEGDVAATAETSEENPVDGETAAATEAPAEETPADTTAATEAPAEQAPAQEAAAATEAPTQEAAPSEQTQQTTEETPAVQETPAAETGETTETEGETEKLALGETTDPTAISITLKATEEGAEDKVRYFDTIQHAIDAAPGYDAEKAKDATVIEVSGQIALDAKVTVPANKKVCIRAKDAVTITRASDTFVDDMFNVSGENAELQFDVKEGTEGAALIISGAAGTADAQVAGTIINVSDGAAVGIYTGITLTGNNSSAADGGAITNKGGSVVLYGGTITGNTGVKGGGIYSDASINMQGTVVVKDNKKGTAVSNICLDGEATVINVTDVLTNSDISFAHLNEANDLKVVTAGKNSAGTDLSADNFKTAFDTSDATKSQIKYENTTAYTLALSADNLSAVLQQVKTPDPDPVNPEPDPGTTTTPTPEAQQQLTLTYVSGSITWVDYSTITVTYTNNVAYKWDYYFVDPDTSNAQIIAMNDGSKLSHSVETTNKNYTMKISSVPADKKWLVICAKPENGKAIYKVFKLNTLYRNSSDKSAKKTFWSQRPSDPSKKNTRAVRTYKVSESTVTGLENPLKFFPSKHYDFTVVGAGQNDKDPITGDERWVPIYWSISKNPTSDKQKNTSWKIGSPKGIKDANTYIMYIFFRKQTYTEGSGWNDTDVIQSMTTQFSSAGYTDDELKEYLKEAKEEGTEIPGYENYTGSDEDGDAELTATAAASEKDAGSKSKSAVSTADESPIGTMSALAALSLLAGGYIVVRKRKKEEQ